MGVKVLQHRAGGKNTSKQFLLLDLLLVVDVNGTATTCSSGWRLNTSCNMCTVSMKYFHDSKRKMFTAHLIQSQKSC